MATHATSTNTGISMASFSSSERYNGLIRTSFFKKIRNMLFALFDYISTSTPHLMPLHSFVSIWRIVQFFGPSLCAGYTKFWKEGSTLAQTVDIISILYQIFPNSIQNQATPYFLYIYSGIFLFLFILTLYAAYHYDTHAELPKWISYTIYLVFSTLGYILQPILGMFIGQTISQMINYPDEFLSSLLIVGVIVAFLCFLCFLVLYSICYSVCITFRPDSLMTIYPTNQTFLIIINFVVAFVPGFAGVFPNPTRFILSLINTLIYLSSFALITVNGGFVHFLHTKLFTAAASGSTVLMTVISVLDFINVQANEIILFVVVGIFVISFVVVSFIVNGITMKHLVILDKIEEDHEKYDIYMKTPAKFAVLAVSGVHHAHPCCLNYNIFKEAITRFPKSLQVWIIFAKFTAIYPEESQQLSFIIHGMMKNRMKGSFAKHTILQIMAIIKQREPNLIPELKKKLNYIGKHVSSCKAKVRYIWELVLQGNVNEMEGMIIKANKSIKSTNSEFQELIGKFPNNRFVARAYVRFLRDVVADHQKSSEWASKCNLLHKGLPVTPDNAHELGVLAFPNLPKEQKAIRHQATFNNNFTEDTLTQEIDENEESVAADQEIKLSLKENIQSLQIPAYTLIRALHLGSLACLFILPMILVSIFAPIYIDSVSSVIPHLYSLTKIRSVLFQGMGVMARYVNENMPETRYPDGHKFAGKLLFPCPTYEEYFVPQLKEPEQAGAGWGSTFDSRGQLVSIAQAVASLMGLIDPIKHYKIGNEAMDNVRTNLFDKIHWVTFIDDLKYTDDWTIFSDNMSHLIITELHEKTSFDKIISHYMTYYSELLNLEKIPHDAYNKHYLMNTLNNLENVTSTVTDTVALMLEYIHSLNSEIQKFTSIAEILFIIVVIIWYLFVCCYTIIKLSKDKIMIYKCLTSLQKSVISKVTDQFRILKKDDEEMRSTRSKDEELSRQEENLLKLFSTSSDSGNSHSIDNLFTIVIAIFVCAVHLVFSTQVIGKFSVVGTNVEITAPHIEHGQASFAFDWESVVLLQLLPGAVFPSVNFEIAGFTTETILYYINFWQVKAQKEFSILKYGDPEKSITSFATIGVNIDSNLNTPDYCNDSDYSPPTNYHDIYDCMSAEVALAFSENIVVRLSNVYTSTDNNLIYDGDDEDLTNLFHLMQHHVFDRFFYGLFRTMSDTVVASLQKEVPAVNKIGYSIVIVAIILEIFYMFIVSASENNQRYALSLLLMCPTKLVLNNQHIISILSGNFSSKNHDSTTRGSEFYDALVEEMPDSVIIMNQNGIITTVNKASTSLFEINKEDLLGQSIRKLGEIFNEENPFTHVFDSVDDLKNKTGFSKSLSFKKENQNYHVNLTLNILPDAIFLTCRDVTQEVMYNKLIQDEKNRSDSLLASILPARLVSRVSAGEKNISFAVQSATIIFIDIVSFTPWCGSTPADKVMRTLNLMFKYFDYSTSQHPTMTKCKCIGDCYMAAGGIFADVNQPATHAKDVVEFGLEALDNIDKLNQEINENLRIRVGINTGGPIVAGVLGTEKPTFEILGPTINMAQQMELNVARQNRFELFLYRYR